MMNKLIKRILKEEFEVISQYEETDFLSPEEEGSLPTVILVGGLDTGGYKNITQQKNLLKKGLGPNFTVIAHRWTEKENAKESIKTYPNSYVVLFSKGGQYSESFASFLKNSGGDLRRMYIVEPYSCSSGTKNSVNSAVSKGVPKSNVLGGSSDCTGKNVAGTKTNCGSKKGNEVHWCALTEAGEIISYG
jgi:hypothetical protein